MRTAPRPARTIALLVALSTAVAASPAALAWGPPPQPSGVRLAMYAKPAVVRVLAGFTGEIQWTDSKGVVRLYDVYYGASGSGAFVDSNGYIVTNASVIDPSRQGEEKGRDALFNAFVTMLAQQAGENPDTWLADRKFMNFLRGQTRFTKLTHVHHAVLPDGSTHPFEIKAAGAPAGAGKDVAVVKIEATNVPVLELGDSDAAQLLDHVTVAGYPGAADTFSTGILDEQSAFEASITDGKLSAKKAAADGAPILQISAPTARGSSGGPVLNDAGQILGLTAFAGDKVNGQEVSGFGFAVPSSTILEFVRQAGAVNELGAADVLYREGLALYWQGKYVSAMEKFEEVKRLYPRHSEVDALIRGSQEAVANGAFEIDWFWTGVIAAAALLFLAAAFLLLAAVIALVVWRRRRARRAPRPAYAPQPDMAYAAYHVPPSGNTIRLSSPPH